MITYIDENIIRVKVDRRGGGIEIDLSNYGYEGHKMTACQNYLGGGILGRIGHDCTIKNWQENEELMSLARNLKEYFHMLSNSFVEEYDRLESASFDDVQARPETAIEDII